MIQNGHLENKSSRQRDTKFLREMKGCVMVYKIGNAIIRVQLSVYTIGRTIRYYRQENIKEEAMNINKQIERVPKVYPIARSNVGRSRIDGKPGTLRIA